MFSNYEKVKHRKVVTSFALNFARFYLFSRICYSNNNNGFVEADNMNISAKFQLYPLNKVKKNCVYMFSCFSFSAYFRFFFNVLIDMNVNISNELNFSDVYRSVNYMGSLAKLHEPLRRSFTLLTTQCSLHFDKPQKNGIH